MLKRLLILVHIYIPNADRIVCKTGNTTLSGNFPCLISKESPCFLPLSHFLATPPKMAPSQTQYPGKRPMVRTDLKQVTFHSSKKGSCIGDFCDPAMACGLGGPIQSNPLHLLGELIRSSPPLLPCFRHLLPQGQPASQVTQNTPTQPRRVRTLPPSPWQSPEAADITKVSAGNFIATWLSPGSPSLANAGKQAGFQQQSGSEQPAEPPSRVVGHPAWRFNFCSVLL